MTQTTVKIAQLGLDVGDSITHFCALDEQRQVVERGRFRTTPEALREVLGVRPATRVVLEAGSQSPWMSALLRELGHQVQVADPRRVELISKGPKKTDRRDAEMLARLACGMPELIGDIHHRSSQEQAHVALLRSRDLLVRMRTKCVQHVRGTCKAFGLRLRSCSARGFHRAVREALPDLLLPALQPLLTMLSDLERQIRGLEKQLNELAKARYPVALRLQQVNGVGPITSLAFTLTLADPKRFRRSRAVGSWVGLCPRMRASGDRDPQLPISKSGDGYLRRLLVQSAQYMLGPFGRDSDLRRFGQRFVERGGKGAKRRAVVAVARKLAVLLHRLWVGGEIYEPLRNVQRLAAPADA